MKAHVVDESALATRRSSSDRARRGIRAERPGSNSAHMIVSRNSSTQTSQTICAERTSSMESTISARHRSAKIITARRGNRSLSAPALGATKTCGSTCRTTAMPMALALPVSSSSSEYSATV